MTPTLSHDAPATIPQLHFPQLPPRFPMTSAGAAPHIPVLGPRAVELLNVRDGGVYIDATFGAGGYSRAILDMTGSHVIGIDRDQSAIALGADLVQSAMG